jgi:glutamine amidotransferase
MKSKTIGIIDYGSSNLLSISQSIKSLGHIPIICQRPEDLHQVTKIIFPGVGAFSQCVSSLSTKGFTQALNDAVIHEGKFILGICLGMQVMAKKGYEGGCYQGLGWFDAEIIKISSEHNLHVPHVGWNEVTYQEECPLFCNLPSGIKDFYFVHSYHMHCKHQVEIAGTFNYGQQITAAVWKENIFGVQFHPEKSQDIGLKLLDNFINLD